MKSTVQGITIECEPAEVHAVRGRWKAPKTFSVKGAATLCKIDLRPYEHRHRGEKCMNIVNRPQVTCLVCLATAGPTPKEVPTSARVPELAGV